ncbi:MAG: glycerol-3-phosphate acyltransferase [Chloroflexi bacterium]|nr:glycerol-3-phosphate acyltransferase [Chloroflexota bacterium]
MNGLSLWNILFALLAGYLIGSFPTGVVLARVLRGPDPRTAGSGHTGGSNMLRTSGLVPALITGAFDVLKGLLAVWLVLRLIPNPWVIPLVGTAAVAGHCWSAFAGLKGGMGIATGLGLGVWFFPLAVLILGLFFLLLQRFIRHRARAMMIVAALIPMVLLVLGSRGTDFLLGVGVATVLIIRFASDFNRVYS